MSAQVGVTSQVSVPCAEQVGRRDLIGACCTQRMVVRLPCPHHRPSKGRTVMLAVGVDTHKESLAVCAVDELGRVIKEEIFGNDPPGHRDFVAWL